MWQNAQCHNCEGLEQYNCANIEEQRKLVYQSGKEKYLCTECLMNFPMLALEVISTGQPNADSQVLAVDVEKEPEVNENSLDMPAMNTETDIAETANFKCEECGIETVTKSQLEEHKILQHREAINYSCQKCEFSYNTKANLEEHTLNVHSLLKCRKCEFSSVNQQDIDVHEWTSHLKCNKCEEEFENQKNLDEHTQKHVQLL